MFVFFFILYAFSYGLILLNRGIFWDDWVAFNTPVSILIAMDRQLGMFWTGFLSVFLISLPFGILLQRGLTFALYFISGIFLYNILKNIKEIKAGARFFIVLFFLLFPLNSARILFTTTNYAVNYFTFYLAFWLLSKYLNKQNLLWRFLALVTFFFSFSTNSFLVFYLLALAYIVYCQKNILRYLDFILLPLFFWLIKILFFTPFGVYEGYNKIKIQNLLGLPINLFITFYTSFLAVLNKSLQLSFPQLIVLLIISSIFFITLKFKKDDENNKINFLLFVFGWIAFILAAIPYLTVGAIPSLNEWSSRHQLLLPLGASFILYYGLKILLNKLRITVRLQNFIFFTIIIIFVNANITNYLAFQKDWYKQYSLSENIKTSEILKNNTSFLFIDNLRELNANGRTYRYYEYTGLMEYAFGDQKRFGADINRISVEADFISGEKFKESKRTSYLSFYNLKDYLPKDFEYKVIINPGDIVITDKNVFKFMMLEIFEPLKFREKIKNLVNLSYVKF